MLLADELKEFLLEIQIRNYTPKTQKGYKGNDNLPIRNKCIVAMLVDI